MCAKTNFPLEQGIDLMNLQVQKYIASLEKLEIVPLLLQ